MLKDKNGNPSLTRTLYAMGFAVACFKLMVAGMTLGSFKMSPFSGVDFGAVISALGGIYHLGKTQADKEK